ncbi:hypothetical protein BY996DRAFT_8684242 [Phakopsora pachyrhizi]|uniref:Expressed protein n=1 Tax=Phakopsora pachyrhizi TaxID=170000 RepID=A0AAV0BKT1_PHAPC|nr:hypothetical protein BY996DRAFT_8684242 [Phakopsora pachyrhizi]CAH7686957.1 expressed protein [Phakopsora pachyrhizi]
MRLRPETKSIDLNVTQRSTNNTTDQFKTQSSSSSSSSSSVFILSHPVNSFHPSISNPNSDISLNTTRLSHQSNQSSSWAVKSHSDPSTDLRSINSSVNQKHLTGITTSDLSFNVQSSKPMINQLDLSVQSAIHHALINQPVQSQTYYNPNLNLSPHNHNYHNRSTLYFPPPLQPPINLNLTNQLANQPPIHSQPIYQTQYQPQPQPQPYHYSQLHHSNHPDHHLNHSNFIRTLNTSDLSTSSCSSCIGGGSGLISNTIGYGLRTTREGYSYSSTVDSLSNHRMVSKPNGSTRLPERLRCEPCKQDFVDSVSFTVHKGQHLRCSEPGCTFEAKRSIVTIHQEDRHLKFSAERLKSLQDNSKKRLDGPPNATIQGLGYSLKTEEQISKWIEERRRRWPTAKLIKQKAEQAEALKERQQQERMNQESLRNKENGKRGSFLNRIDLSNSAKDLSTAHSAKRSEHPQRSFKNADCKRKRNEHETGEDDIREGEELFESVDSEENESVDYERDAVSSKAIDGVETLSKRDYCEDQGENEESVQEDGFRRVDGCRVGAEGGRRDVVCKWWKMNRCKKGDQCLFLHPKNYQNKRFDKMSSDQRQREKSKNNRFTSNGCEESIFGDRSGLLSKLLKKDIDQDVNDLLSVMEFLVRNEFLNGVERSIGEFDELEGRLQEVKECKNESSDEGSGGRG